MLTPEQLKEHAGETANVKFFMPGIGNTVFVQGGIITSEGRFDMTKETREQVLALIHDPCAPPNWNLVYLFDGKEYLTKIAGF